jgi:hypothetical protein
MDDDRPWTVLVGMGPLTISIDDPAQLIHVEVEEDKPED